MSPPRFSSRTTSATVRAIASSLALFAVSACGGRLEVETLHPRRAEIRSSFSEPARTHLEHTWRITMPVAGRIGRIDLLAGDEVSIGQELARFDLLPFEQDVVEARAAIAELKASLVLNAYNEIEESVRDEVEKTILVAEDSIRAAEARVEAEQARSDRADRELARLESLDDPVSVSPSALDDVRLASESSTIELRAQEFSLAAFRTLFTIVKLGPRYVDQWLNRKSLQREELTARLNQLEARLARAEHQLALAELTSPIGGVVLQKLFDGGASLPAGAPLLLLGSLSQLEIIADVLTQDALALETGGLVELESRLGAELLEGRIARIEPAAFTKLSTLGVEQQRVNVHVRFVERDESLGLGYRLRARFITNQKADALIVPRPAVLQDPAGTFYVFAVESGRLARRDVTLGLGSDLELEVLSGLTESDEVLATPDATMSEGERVE